MDMELLHGYGGGKGKINIFTKPDEPLTKEGIWIQTPEAFNYSRNLGITNSLYTKLLDVPYPRNDSKATGTPTAVGNVIYLFGGQNGVNVTNISAYNTVDNTWFKETNLTTIPTTGYGVDAITVGNKVYYWNSVNSTNAGYFAYSFDYTTKEVVELTRPTNCYYATIQYYNGKIYAIGGSTAYTYTSFNTNVQEYNISTNTWTNKSTIPRNMAFSVSELINGKIYIFGGYSASSTVSNVVNIYDIANNTWSIGTNSPNLRTLCGHWVDDSNRIHFIGGYAGTNEDIYDVTNNSWSIGNTNIPVMNPTSVPTWVFQTLNGKVYCFGYDAGTVTNDGKINVYDILNNTWSSNVKPLAVRTPTNSVLLNDTIYTLDKTTAETYNTTTNVVSNITGLSSVAPSLPYRSVLVNNASNNNVLYSTYTNSTVFTAFYTSNNTTATRAPLPVASQSRPAIIGVGDYIYLLFNTITNNYNVYKYDTINNVWSIDSSNFPALYKTVTFGFGLAVVGTKIYVFGGYGSGGVSVFDVNIYDTVNKTWSIGQSIPVGKSQFGCVSVGVKIYCIYGEDLTNAKASLDTVIYDTTSNTWSYGIPYPYLLGNNYSTGVTSIYINGCIYTVGGDTGHSVWKYDVTPETIVPLDKSIVLLRYYNSGGKYETELFTNPLRSMSEGTNTRLVTSFDDAFVYDGGYLDYPSYYGNGVEWIKFKN